MHATMRVRWLLSAVLLVLVAACVPTPANRLSPSPDGSADRRGIDARPDARRPDADPVVRPPDADARSDVRVVHA